MEKTGEIRIVRWICGVKVKEFQIKSWKRD